MAQPAGCAMRRFRFSILYFGFFGQFFHALHVIFVADHSHIFHLDHDDIFKPDGIDLTFCCVVDEDIRAAQFMMIAKGPYSLLISGKELAVLLPVADIVPARDRRE